MQTLFRILDRVADPYHGKLCLNTGCAQRVPLGRSELRRLTIVTVLRTLMASAILFGGSSLIAMRIHAQGFIPRSIEQQMLSTKMDLAQFQISALVKSDGEKDVRIAHLENTVATMQGIGIGLSVTLAVLQVLLLVFQRKRES